MIVLGRSLRAWGTPAFESMLKEEIEELDGNLLPLQQGLSRTSHAIPEGFRAIILKVTELPGVIRVKAGISYKGVIAGCSCADDPTPVDEVTEYCVVQFDIDRTTAETQVSLLESE